MHTIKLHGSLSQTQQYKHYTQNSGIMINVTRKINQQHDWQRVIHLVR